MIGYIYIIENKLNGKQYVGLTTSSIEKRWGQHKTTSRASGRLTISSAIRKYGEENFKMTPLYAVTGETKEIVMEKLNKWEVFWIKHLDTYEDGYNCTLGGGNATHSKETREKMSESHMGRTHSAETKAKIGKAHKGRSYSKETIKRMKEASLRRGPAKAYLNLLAKWGMK